jgi:hypothetical protein
MYFFLNFVLNLRYSTDSKVQGETLGGPGLPVECRSYPKNWKKKKN